MIGHNFTDLVLKRVVPIFQAELSKPPQSLGWVVGNAQVYTGAIGSEVELTDEELESWRKFYGVNKATLMLGREASVFQPVIRIFGYLGISGTGPFNAFIAMNVFAKDAENNLLTGTLNSNGIFEPVILAESSIWFSRPSRYTEEQRITVACDKSGYFRCSMPLPHEDAVLRPIAPDHARTQHLFWQISQFLPPYSDRISRHPLC